MLNGKTIAVVIPAYNEEKQIGHVIETMPDFVDRIVIINDCSKDNTEDIIKSYITKTKKLGIRNGIIKKIKKDILATKYNEAEIVAEEIKKKEDSLFTPSIIINDEPEKDYIILINHKKNAGVGAAITTGYKWAKDHHISCTAVMAGDGQMDPDELASICSPIIEEGIDYVKGNRLIHRSAWLVIPRIRYIGNSILSIMTKIASGYWHISDTQTGYTAISLKALNSIRLYKIYKRFGMPNDILVKLNIAFCTIKEIEIKPVYRVGENSKMRIFKVIPKIFCLLIISFFKRLWIKYFFRDFHPLFLFYNLSFLLTIINIPITIRIIYDSFILGKSLTYQILIAFMFSTISCLQSLFFAMWMDIQDNERLDKSLEK